MRYLVVIIAFLSFTSCEKQVDINDPYPIEVEYCLVNDNLLGEWISDSIRIVTDVDTLDSLIVEEGPALFYYLNITCGEPGSLMLSYFNYAGVETVDISSTNFEANEGSIRVYNAADTQHQNPEGVIEYQLSDGLLTLEFSQNPNAGQQTDYTIFMSPLMSAN
ncbi:MAG: hypothetical protein HN542_04090 [Flavobacteriales bacterium]|jgi:hypothetical protein|nr:hypothetical protein [Flavobacteriales bacterium]NCG29313.1 hypothetical protein [Bacteroidota bacterium]MBT3962516.1 hypothetical protein [Flavobacteriales bacterium]MBT4706033.1 hypothetical protein [Flavobacteriales bacterium]MBT4931445.1 hypothetical protein [Flavobacteriales bacterium]